VKWGRGKGWIFNSGLYGLNIKVSFHWSKDLNWHFCRKLFTHLVKRYSSNAVFQVYVKREGRTLFLLPKVKVEFRHLFSLQKRFNICSYHNINTNIVVFGWLTGLQWNNTRFEIPSGLDNFLSYSFPDLIIQDLNWHFCRKLFTHLVKRYSSNAVFLYFQIDWDKEKVYFNARDLSWLFSYFLKLYFDLFISINIIMSVETGIEYHKPELSMIRSCPSRLEFKNECYSTVNQSISKKHRYLH
jgi:hypothetical protein